MDVRALSFDRRTFELSEAAKVACDVRLDIRDDQRDAQLEAGTWWVLPIARSWAEPIWGLRMVPALAPAGWPFVIAMGGNVKTISSTPAHAVPHLLLEGMRADWDRVAAAGDDLWGELLRLHRALGGGADALERLRRVATDPAVRAACIDRSRPIESRMREQARTATVVDPTPGLAARLEYVLGAVLDGRAPWPPPGAGCFDPAIATMAFVTHHDAGSEREARLAAWQVVQSPPSLDPQSLATVGFYATLASDGGKTALEAARTVVRGRGEAPDAWLRDPLWPALEAHAEAGMGYDGGVHLEAARALEGAGGPERALSSLAIASYWATRAGEDWRASWEAARALAGRAGWHAIAEALEEVGTARRDPDRAPPGQAR